MNDIHSSVDARQTREWGTYLKTIGWKTETIGSIKLFIRPIPFLRSSVIKIQHPHGPLPLRQIDDEARKYRAILTIIEPNTIGCDEREFVATGYEPSKLFFSHTSTIKIDITRSELTLFKSFSENARRNIKKAQEKNLTTKVVPMGDKNNWNYFDVFYELLLNVGRMKKFYVPPRAEYIAKMNAFKKRSFLVFAYEKDAPIAVVWYACFSNVIAYFQTGITKRGYDTMANYLLVWEGLLLGKKEKCTVFDFESIYDERFPNVVTGYKRYTEFKKRFHGDVIRYPRPWIKIHSFLGRVIYTCQTLL